MRRLLAVALVALATPAGASAAGYAVGVRPGISFARAEARLAAATGRPVSGDPELRAVYVHTSARGRPARVYGVSYVERLGSRRLAFVPDDPLSSKQWYLGQIHAFDFWPQFPTLIGTRVAVVDSGIDGSHPEFKGRIVAAKSFVGGSARTDVQGHGTFVAGEIAADTDNGIGISGIAFPAQLLIAKVVRSDRTIPLRAEASAIRWAVDSGARVINLSLAGLRDPLAPKDDTYSPLEASAIRYAVSKGVLVVAAVGNSDQAPRVPWNFAGYPAALPHVVGVSALEESGSVPAFSNRDAFFNDISAPGADILSTLPFAMTAQTRPPCVDQGYSDCGPPEFRHAEGTSFSAPMVTAAAALVLSIRPSLTPDQVAAIVEHSADDMSAATGCRACPAGRDRLTGWGRVDVAAAVGVALNGPIPKADSREPNDDAGSQASTIWLKSSGKISATVDFWEDPIDVYRIHLSRGQKLSVDLNGPTGGDNGLLLWKPGTEHVGDLSPIGQRNRVAQSVHAGSVEHIHAYRAPSAGWYYIEVKLTSGKATGPYTLTYSRSGK